MMFVEKHFVFLILAVSCFRMLRFMEAKSKLPLEEVDALQQVTTTMGARDWNYDSDPCETQMIGIAQEAPQTSENSIACDCSFENSTVCHVVRIVLKGYSLPGVLPPELVKLPYLKEVDFAYNYLEGTIPREWGSMQLTFLSVLVNRLSGAIPKELGNITTLTYLSIEANQFSGTLPPELGNLINLNTMILSSNQLTGNLPPTFAGLRNLTDFRINDNNFSGIIPGFIQNWIQLHRLELHASGLEGPIPSNISLLNDLVQLRISDIKGPSQSFPMLRNMTKLIKLVLRSCNISGEIPAYIWTMNELTMLDFSFNKLVGEIPLSDKKISAKSLKFVFLTGNLLSGDVPDSVLKEGGSIDLSYNNFTWQGPEQLACRPNLNLHVNLFRSSIVNDGLRGILPCSENKDLQCSEYSNCFHVNCGGTDATIKENNRDVVYEGDGEVEGGAAKYFHRAERNWGFSSTGDFMDDDNFINTRYTASLPSSNISELDTTARMSPLSLTYFYYCLENGKYNVTLQFAEIQFRNESTYNSLGRRLFDTYVQEELVLKDFNIEKAAGGVQKSVVKVINVGVTNNILEIRFHWAGKGTTRIPKAGVYGPLISAISVVHESELCLSRKRDGKGGTVYVISGIAAGVALGLILAVLGFLWWKGSLLGRGRKKGSDGPDVLTSTFTLKQIKTATNDFDSALKIGEGGFGPVYKGELPDGRVIAVKQLSSKSRQGNREFLNEIGMISCLQHPNLVKLHGCCIEGDQLLLVYEYMENNNLARALFSQRNSGCKLDWPTRLKVCIGIAKGLAFLHEESMLKIVHRDIKATNVLLDKDLNSKISDFGLAKLYEDEKTHVSTRIAGTIGYMAPEYALWGHLSYKADVYSFGVLALEIVSGKNNNNYMPSENFVCLLDKAYHLQRIGHLMELVDEELKSEINIKEAEIMVKVALLCTNVLPSGRPTMSEAASMLEGRMPVPDTIPEPSSSSEDLRFKGMRDLHQQQMQQNPSSSASQTQSSTTATTLTSSSSRHGAFHEINPEPNH